MSTNPVYSLENLWSFSDDQIKQILQYFGHQILNLPSTDRLNAIILSFNNNLLAPKDRTYVMSPEFNKLFSATDKQLRILAQERGLIDQRNHIGLLKYIIDNINAPVIPIVSTIPTNITQALTLYQMGDNLYLCGTKTFNLREQLKSLGGTWNPNIKCWSFPLNVRSQLFVLLSPVTQVPSTILEITQVPNIIPENLQIYQMNGQILLCGKRTYNIQDKLRTLNGRFDKDVGCWVFPPQQADAILNLYNETVREDYLEAQRIQEQRRLTRQENQAKAQQQAEENAARQIRLRTPEIEATYIPHINLLPSNIIEETHRNGTYNNLAYQIQGKDIDELRPLWDDKIQVLSSKNVGSTRGATYIVTYTGNIKPPDLALSYKANGWQYMPFGANVRRIDYKKYEVSVSGTD